jgi:alpha-beta hydrolase superfamily lysophospholipase
MSVEVIAPVKPPVARGSFIAAGDRPLFVWHHAPPPQFRRRAAIVLCPPLGYEYMSAYQTWRILAERLAALGFDALRVDYDGTGNSYGDQEDPDRVGAWVRSIDAALSEARRLSESDAVALIGLRAGALLALDAAAATGGVERLVLWAPFPTGRAHVRELKALAGLSRQDHAREDEDPAAMNVAGHLFPTEAIESLGRWAPDQLTIAPGPQVLLVDRDDRPIDPKIAARLESLGSHVTRTRPPGTAAMLVLPQLAVVPEPALEEITSWFSDWHRTPSPGAAIAGTAAGDHAVLARDGFRERPIRFGPDDRLFGVLVTPDDPAADCAPAIILMNTGVEVHVGPHRLFVPLAREWAAGGHLVLRFDLAGIGDSPPLPGAAENVSYPRHMLEDVREAVAFIRREAPRRPVIVAGLCSGAWSAFHAARQGLDVDAIVAVNPPLYLRDGEAAMQWLTEGDELGRYRQSLSDPSKWVRALRRGSSYATSLRVAVNLLRRHITVRATGVRSHHLPDGLANDLCVIAERRIDSLLVFSRGDDSLKYFQLHAQPALHRPEVREFVRTVVVDGAGHTFRPRAAQIELRRLLNEFVARIRDAD